MRAGVTAVVGAGSWELGSAHPGAPGSLGCAGTQLVGPGVNKAVKMLDFGACP